MNRKAILVNNMGGHCQMCGYDKNMAVLCFHHIDPSTKELTLDSRHLSNHSWNKIHQEAKKCMLLCHNCHMEIHNKNHWSQVNNKWVETDSNC